MKKHLLLFLFFTYNLAQAQVKEVIVSKPFNVSEVDLYWQNEQKIISANDSFVLVELERNESKMLNMKSSKNILVKYDAKTLEKLSEKELPFSLNWVLDSNAYSFWFHADSDNRYITKYNLLTQDTFSIETPFEKTEENEKVEKKRGLLRFCEKPNAFLAIQYLRKAEGNIAMGYKVIGFDFKDKLIRSFELPFSIKKSNEESHYLHDIELDNAYNLYFRIEVENPKERKYKSPSHSEIIKYSLANEKIYRYEVDLGSDLYNLGTEFYTDEKSNILYIFGPYSINNDLCANGYYMMQFDLTSNSRILFEKFVFSEQLAGEIKKKGYSGNKKNDICYIGSPVKIRLPNVESETGHLFKFSLNSTQSNSLGEIILRIDEKGRLEKSFFHYFEQSVGHLYSNQSGSKVLAITDTTTYIFYNDRTNRNWNPEYQKYIKSKTFDAHIPFVAVVNIDKERKVKYPLLPLAEQEMKIHPYSIVKFSDKVFYAVASKKLEHVIVKIVLE